MFAVFLRAFYPRHERSQRQTNDEDDGGSVAVQRPYHSGILGTNRCDALAGLAA
jgi:hypothetical protein